MRRELVDVLNDFQKTLRELKKTDKVRKLIDTLEGSGSGQGDMLLEQFRTSCNNKFKERYPLPLEASPGDFTGH